MAGVFFEPLSTTARLADTAAAGLAGQKLATAARHGRRVEPQGTCHATIAAAPHSRRFEPRVEAPLALVEKAEKQRRRRPQAAARPRCERWRRDRRGGARAKLPAPRIPVSGTIQVAPIELFPGEPPAAGQTAQHVTGGDPRERIELGGEQATRRRRYQRLGGCDKAAMRREPDAVDLPQPVHVEPGEFSQGVVPAAMGIAGPVVKLLQFQTSGLPTIILTCGHGCNGVCNRRVRVPAGHSEPQGKTSPRFASH